MPFVEASDAAAREIERISQHKSALASLRVAESGDCVELRFRYDAKMVAAVRSIVDGNAWRPDLRYWAIPLDCAKAVRNALHEIGADTADLDTIVATIPAPEPAYVIVGDVLYRNT